MARKRKWIKGAIKRPGALRAAAKRAGALTPSGTIKLSWLRDQVKSSNPRRVKQARLALTMRGFKGRKRGTRKKRKPKSRSSRKRRKRKK